MNRKSKLIAAGIVGVFVVVITAIVIVNAAGSGQPLAGFAQVAEELTESDRERFRTEYETDDTPIEKLSEEHRVFLLRDQEWAKQAEFVGVVQGLDALVSAWSASLQDPNGILNTTQKNGLLQTIAEHALARARSTPDAYIKLVDSDPNIEWNEPDSSDPERLDIRRRNVHIGVFYKWFIGEEFNPLASSRSMIDHVWEMLAQYDHLIDAVGLGSHGARILVIKVRSPAELRDYGLKGKYAPDNANYWWSFGGRYGMEFSRPVASAIDLVQKQPSLTVAFANIIIRLRDGRLGNWQSLWYLHPETDAWVLDHLSVHSGKTVILVW